MGNLTVYAADLAGTFISGFGTGAAATASVAATAGGGYVVVPGAVALTGALATSTAYFAGRAKNDSDRLKDSIEERLNGGEKNSSSDEIQFPEDPDDFNPEGLRKIGPFETKNGKIIKWVDENNKAVYEWDEDLTYGSHYHVIDEDGNTRLPDSDGKTHFFPGDIFKR